MDFELKEQDIIEISRCVKNLLGENDLAFFNRVYQTPGKQYNDRLQAIGFINHDHVLDAGCGFGQWSLELARLNCKVSALDVASERLFVLDKLLKKINCDNVYLKQGGLDNLPYDDDSFDAIFCYGAIFVTSWKTAISEFRRVLANNGKLYVNANGLGWFIHKWLYAPNKTGDFDPKRQAANAFVNTATYESEGIVNYSGGLIIDRDAIIKELKKHGFEIIGQGAEGTINLVPEKIDIKPFFKGEYEGQAGVFEILAKKD